METVHKLESTFAKWYEKAPHLPKGGRDWIADNIWWIVLIGVIIGAMGIVGILAALLLGTALLGVAGGVFGIAAGSAITLAILTSFAFTIAIIILHALAIQPLRAKQKRGWELVFVTMLLDIAMTILNLLFGGHFSNFLQGLIGVAIGGYLLFEIRSHFVLAHKS